MFSPGQDLQELISRLSVDHVGQLLGEDVVATVSALKPQSGVPATLRGIAHDFFHYRPDDLLGSSQIRGICYDAMTTDKLDELAGRLSLDDRRRLRSFDPLQDIATRQRYFGFFGIDAHAATPSQLEPDLQDAEPSFGLFPHQRQAANRVWSALEGVKKKQRSVKKNKCDRFLK
ncbi:MAG: hypothetical protein OXH37_12195, partial [Gammaproteobacteria bacterium]|nr:hypothetical protein [Gammaproteobacteria bacterium]